MKIDDDHQRNWVIGGLPVYDINKCRSIGIERDIDHTNYEIEDTISMSDTYMLLFWRYRPVPVNPLSSESPCGTTVREDSTMCSP